MPILVKFNHSTRKTRKETSEIDSDRQLWVFLRDEVLD